MYMDSYVISSIVIVVLTIVVVAYLGWFGYRHIRQDIEKNKGQENSVNGLKH